jgi:hypothetical protein
MKIIISEAPDTELGKVHLLLKNICDTFYYKIIKIATLL